MSGPSPPRDDDLRNLWAPWRIQYIREISAEDTGCFLCRYAPRPECDDEQLVLWRGERVFAVLNRFPYSGGHLLVAPYEHVGEMEGLDEPTLLELMTMSRDAARLLREALNADGLNVGMNLGRCAGAGLPGHVHVHVVPRWGGDTNFMSVIDDVRVIPESLAAVLGHLRETSRSLDLPRRPGEARP
jgi:ATP adenylyltransferase